MLTSSLPRIFALLGVGAATLLLQLTAARSMAAIVIESGDFVTKAISLESLAFGTGSNLYVAPTQNQRNDFAALAATLLAGDLNSADAQAMALNYNLVEFTDNVSQNVYYGLTEQLVDNKPTRGWGSFFVNFDAVTAVLVQAPHPKFDSNTPEIAARAFQLASARGYLLAGAHRNANGQGTADVAHLPTSIFQEVHIAWNGPQGENTAWSIHGFDIDNDDHEAFPLDTDAVISNGDGGISAEILAMNNEFESVGFETYAYNTLDVFDPLNVAVNGAVAGNTFSSLGGTTNVQGVYSRGLGGTFVHVEMEQSVRLTGEANRIIAAEAIADAILATALIPEPTSQTLALIGFACLCRRIRRRISQAEIP
jgi:hypothetical protein